MKISELPEDRIKIGLRIKSLANPNKLGTIVKKEVKGSETVWWILWDGDEKPMSGFYWNHCDCEVYDSEAIDETPMAT
jgi:hypothetical protein